MRPTKDTRRNRTFHRVHNGLQADRLIGHLGSSPQAGVNRQEIVVSPKLQSVPGKVEQAQFRAFQLARIFAQLFRYAALIEVNRLDHLKIKLP